MSCADVWDAVNAGSMRPAPCSCSEGTRIEEPPAGMPEQISEVVVCEGCGKVVDTR